MNNNQTLTNVFVSILEIDETQINKDLKYQSVPQWDSINHMFLVGEIENVFGIEIDSDDIMEIKSFDFAKEVLAKYEVKF